MSKCKFNIGDKAYYYEFYLDDKRTIEIGIDEFIVESIEKRNDVYYVGTSSDERGFKEIFIDQSDCYKTLDECKTAIINNLTKELEEVKSYKLEEN